MAGVNQLITLGIGAPSDIGHFITLGLLADSGTVETGQPDISNITAGTLRPKSVPMSARNPVMRSRRGRPS